MLGSESLEEIGSGTSVALSIAAIAGPAHLRLLGPMKDLRTPSSSVTRKSEKEALVCAMTTILRPQTLACKDAKDAVVRILDD
jgi:hypothetical protein